MMQIDIYTSNFCSYCLRAKHLLDLKGVIYTEFNVDGNEKLAYEAIQRSGGMRTVPQIFIEGHHIGGYDDLYRLDQEGKLDLILGINK